MLHNYTSVLFDKKDKKQIIKHITIPEDIIKSIKINKLYTKFLKVHMNNARFTLTKEYEFLHNYVYNLNKNLKNMMMKSKKNIFSKLPDEILNIVYNFYKFSYKDLQITQIEAKHNLIIRSVKYSLEYTTFKLYGKEFLLSYYLIED